MSEVENTQDDRMSGFDPDATRRVTHTTFISPDDTRKLDYLGELMVEEHSIPQGFYEKGKVTRTMERELMLICSEMFELFEDERNGKVQSEKIPEFTIW